MESYQQVESLSNINEQLGSLLANHTLLLWDKWGSQGRHIYTAIPSLRPQIAFAEHTSWGNVRPEMEIVRERLYPGRRDDAPKSEKVLLNQLYDKLDGSAPPAIMTWYETPIKRKLIENFGGILLTQPESVRRKLEDKSRLPNILKEVGLSPSVSLKNEIYPDNRSIPNYFSLINQFGDNFVIQGWSMGGDGTVFINSADDLEKAGHTLQGQIRISECCNQQYSNVCVLTVPRGNQKCDVYVEIPSHKATHIPELGISAVEGAGADFSLPYPNFLPTQMIENIQAVGTYLYKEYGLIGHWQFEGFMSEAGFQFNEINARPGGGSKAAAIIEILRDMPPFWAVQILLSLRGDTSYLPSAIDYNHQTIDYIKNGFHPSPFYLKYRLTGNSPARIKNPECTSGIYNLNDSHFSWRGMGQSPLEADFDRGEVLIADLPLSGSICDPGKEVAFIEGMNTDRPIFSGPHQLSSWGHQLATATRDLFIATNELK